MVILHLKEGKSIWLDEVTVESDRSVRGTHTYQNGTQVEIEVERSNIAWKEIREDVKVN